MQAIPGMAIILRMCIATVFDESLAQFWVVTYLPSFVGKLL